MADAAPLIVSGAGLAGSLLAISLAQRGYKVEIYERRGDMRKEEVGAGRSINLAMSARALNALKQVGLDDEIAKISIPMYARMMHDLAGKQYRQPYSRDGKSAIQSVSRGELNCRLMTLAERAGAKIHFHHRTTDVDLRGANTITLLDEISGKAVTLKHECLFGADGAYSSVRHAMLNTPRFDYSQIYLEAGYKELTIPAGPDGAFLLDKNHLHIWPRGTFMLIALPNLDGSFTCTLFLPWDQGKYNFENLTTDEKVMEFFQDQFVDVVPLMPTLLHDFKTNPAATLITVRTQPWVRDHAVLLGDAAHAVVPFFGQGMNCAFEDVFVLDQLIGKFKHEGWSKVLERYQAQRIPNANAIADMALENWIEMRDKTADKHFLVKKAIDRWLGNRYPGVWLSRYECVSFTCMDYVEAVAVGKRNDAILAALTEGKDLDEWHAAGITADADSVARFIDTEKAAALVSVLPPLVLEPHIGE